MTPHPDVLNYLCQLYRHISRADIIACWQNASIHWFDLNPICRIQEPPELIAARTLFVHSQFDAFAEDRSNFSYCMWQLVSPYLLRKS